MVWNTDHALAIGTVLVDGALIGAAVSRVRDGWRVQMIRREGDAPATRLHISEGHATRQAAMWKAEDVAREAFAAKTQAAQAEEATP